jgi:hypothetical protein
MIAVPPTIFQVKNNLLVLVVGVSISRNTYARAIVNPYPNQIYLMISQCFTYDGHCVSSDLIAIQIFAWEISTLGRV